MLLAMDKLTAARSILARAATAKTPGPLKRNCTLFAPVCAASDAAAANAYQTQTIHSAIFLHNFVSQADQRPLDF